MRGRRAALGTDADAAGSGSCRSAHASSSAAAGSGATATACPSAASAAGTSAATSGGSRSVSAWHLVLLSEKKGPGPLSSWTFFLWGGEEGRVGPSPCRQLLRSFEREGVLMGAPPDLAEGAAPLMGSPPAQSSLPAASSSSIRLRISSRAPEK